MTIQLSQDICGYLSQAEGREWLVTNGMGGYASGTVAGMLTRCYHGLLVAALDPPLGRTLLLAKLEDGAQYDGRFYPLSTNRWADGTIDPAGYTFIEQFSLEKTVPVWKFALGEARLEKRIWMQPGVNTTYVRYTLLQGNGPLQLHLKALVNYRDHHGNSQGRNWRMVIDAVPQGVCVRAFPAAVPFYLLSSRGTVQPAHCWYYGFDLSVERYRGLADREDHLHAATGVATLQEGESLTWAVSTEANPNLVGDRAWSQRHNHEQARLDCWRPHHANAPEWVQQLVLAADQFIVQRRIDGEPAGKSVIAGYPWFGDWGRDTMIALPGLTLATGRPEIAGSILRTFAPHVNQGMLPNRFPDGADSPDYNTVDATLWYFQAIRAYHDTTKDDGLLRELYPVLAEIIAWHRQGTRYQIHADAEDGLLYAGNAEVQLTWMDAKVDDWVVTPRTGKPVEVNALWYGVLRSQAHFAQRLGYPSADYQRLADRVAQSFSRFWNPDAGYCYDVIDGPMGNDPALRPNQIFAVSLPESPLSPGQQQQVVDVCGQRLLTPYGLRSLSPDHPDYQGHYGGDRWQRDGAYHQGTVWSWLLGPFALAHWRIYQDQGKALQYLDPIANHLREHGLGTISEIFDGDLPYTPRGCIAQAWSVAEILRAWTAITENN